MTCCQPLVVHNHPPHQPRYDSVGIDRSVSLVATIPHKHIHTQRE